MPVLGAIIQPTTDDFFLDGRWFSVEEVSSLPPPRATLLCHFEGEKIN